jgi:hypothetical protein
LRKECDRRFALAIKERDGWRCVACGSTTGIQCAHICSRRYHATRWMLGNAVALCARCHMRWTNDPLGWDDFVEARLGDAGYQELRTLAKRGVTWIDYEAVLASLPEPRG